MTGNAGFNGYGQPRYGDDTDQVNQYASHSSKSTLSLTYDASFQSQGGGKGDANVPYPTENQLPGYPPLYPTIHEQPEQPTPVSKMRKAPTTNLPRFKLIKCVITLTTEELFLHHTCSIPTPIEPRCTNKVFIVQHVTV